MFDHKSLIEEYPIKKREKFEHLREYMLATTYLEKVLIKDKNFFWYEGIWRDGTWINGYWNGGYWENGTWINGHWNDGTWHNGVWLYGIWKQGFWVNGTWHNGTWHNGTWEKGNWEGGFWDGGEILNKNTGLYEYSKIPPSEVEWSYSYSNQN